MGRPTIKRKPLTDTEKKRRYRAKKKRDLQDQLDAERRARRSEVTTGLAIRRLAIADITEADLASESVDAIITDPPYAEADIMLFADLAHLAMRALKPAGWCLVMSGEIGRAHV